MSKKISKVKKIKGMKVIKDIELKENEIEVLDKLVVETKIKIIYTNEEKRKIKAIRKNEKYSYLPRLTLARIIYSSDLLEGISPTKRTIGSIDGILKKVDDGII